MRDSTAKTAPLVLLFCVLFLPSMHAYADHGRVLAPQQPAVQVSNHSNGVVDDLVISFNGERLAWVYQGQASADLYMVDLTFNYDDNGYTFRVDPVGDSSRARITPSQPAQGQVAVDPSMNDDGTLIVFQSNQNLPGGSNADISPETFLADVPRYQLVAPATFQQLTFNPDPVITPALVPPNPEGRLSSANSTTDGLMVVFSSTRNDLPGIEGQNPDGVEQVILFDKEEDRYYQLTQSRGQGRHNLHPVIDSYGFVVAYLSNDNLSSTYHVYALAIPEDASQFICEGTQDLDGFPGNECGSDACYGDPRCPVEVCDDTNNPPVDEDGNGFANCQDYSSCFDHPACVIPNSPPTLTIVDSATSAPIGSAVTIDENQEISMTLTIEDPDYEFVQIRAYYDDGGLQNLSQVGARLRFVSSLCDPLYEDCSCSSSIETADCLLTGPVVATFTWRPDYTRGGNTYNFVFEANDSDDTSAVTRQTVAVSVNNLNRAPTISPRPLGDKVVRYGQALVIAVTGSDVDKDTLTLRGDSLPSGAELVAVSSSAGSARSEIRWTPTINMVNDAVPYPVAVSVSDGEASVVSQGTIKVVSNRAPTMTITGVGATVTTTTGTDGTQRSQVTITEGKAFRLEVKGSDLDGDIVTLGIDQQSMPAGSVYLFGTGIFSWLPGLDIATSDTVPVTIPVTFTVTDGIVPVTRVVDIIVRNAPQNDVVFMAVNTTMTVTAGSNVSLSIAVKNTGLATWVGTNYALITELPTSGLVVPSPIPMGASESIAPGATKTFTVQFTAPTRVATYSVRFRMSYQGQSFGTSYQTVTVKVQ